MPLPPVPGNPLPTMPPAPRPVMPIKPQPTMGDPIDLWGNFDPPPPPSGLLPAIIEQFSRDLSQTNGADAAGYIAAALAACAAAIPDSVRLHMKPNDGWFESPRLWVALVGLPSTRKSPIITAATRQLREIDHNLSRQHETRWNAWNALDKETKSVTPEPLRERKVLEDVTVEALAAALRGSPAGVALIKDEMSGWFGGMERYGGGKGGSSDRAVYLQSFNGGPYTVDRIARGSNTVPNLSISLIGGIQPSLIQKAAADSADDGLIQRLCPIILRSAELGDEEFTSHAQAAFDYTVTMLTLVRPPLGGKLRFDSGAQRIRRQMEIEHHRLQATELINAKLASHIGKFDGLFGRLCAIWHTVENVGHVTLPETVTEATAARVAAFMRLFLRPHALAFYGGVLDLSDDDDRLKAIAGYVLAHKVTTLTVRDVMRKIHAATPRNLDTDISYDLQSAGLRREGDQRCRNANSMRLNSRQRSLWKP
jgi:hypothetical protein